MSIRVIPRLDIKGPNLVKGIHLEGLRVLGKPEEFARLYYEAGADELLYQDAVASLYGRNSLLDIVARTAAEVFIPLCVGGGLRTVDDIRQVLRAGADKVSINTAAIERPELITEAARSFGSSTVVVCLEVIKQSDGHYECFTDSGRQATGIDALEWAVRATDLGAGELLVTSVDRDGTGRGFDLDLMKSISDAVSTPVIAHGGAGEPDHVVEVIESAGADAVCIASLLHYDAITSIEFRDADFSSEGNVEFRRKGSGFSRVSALSLPALKEHLADHGIDVRVPVAS